MEHIFKTIEKTIGDNLFLDLGPENREYIRELLEFEVGSDYIVTDKSTPETLDNNSIFFEILNPATKKVLNITIGPAE